MAAPVFEHCEVFTHTDLNLIGDKLVEVETVTDGFNGQFVGQEHLSHSIFTFVHTRRFLHTKSTGVIAMIGDFLAVPRVDANDIALSEDSTGYGTYDMDTIPTLSYGQVYIVEGPTIAFEDDYA
jgi:hypothetical protein